ncbi:MAG: hypothetical protein ACHQ49_16435 [Elusimicrobiota bacterium]
MIAALPVLLFSLASSARAQTVSPGDFDPALRARDIQILRRVAGRVSALGENPGGPPSTATFPLTRGTFTSEESWLTDPETGEDVLRGRMSFAPGAACPVCRQVRIVQIARVEVKPGRDIEWGSGQRNRDLIRSTQDDSRGIVAGYFVDHDASKCAKGAACSPYFRDSWPNPDESQDGASAASGAAPASLVDYPFGWQSFERISLEACARCVETGEFFGCVEWGASWPAIGERALRVPRAFEAPSATFREAQGLFDSFY